MKFRVILLLFLTMTGMGVNAQVTIGDLTEPQKYSILELISKGNAGLRLPQLTEKQRDDITTASFKTDTKAEGLAIYNLDTQCYEYWNQNRWISLCEGTSLLTISPDPCRDIPADGTGCDDEFEITDPDCVNGPFSIIIITGNDYASLDKDEDAGTFFISFEPNNSVNMRSVVVRITSSCTAQYKDFLFTQLGQTCNPSLGEAPEISSIPAGKNISFCAGGAVYLSVPAGTPNLDELIWTRNNIEIARGINNIVVTQAGIYDVWMGLIGCHQKAGNAVTVVRDGTGAPSPVNIVILGNNGMVCGPALTTRLVANHSKTGTVRWFKDGILQAESIPDSEIEAGIGQWFAVVNDGNCWSTPSETVIVSLDPNAGTPLTTPVIEIKGSFCAGGSVPLSITNASYNPAYTYTWYENNTPIHSGREIIYQVPSNLSEVVIRCRATLAGSCASEAINVETITTGTIPSLPRIEGLDVLCSGTGTLSIIPAEAGTYTYAWYKNGLLIGTAQTINITEGGDYYATVTNGCTSPMAHKNISNQTSAVPTVILDRTTESPYLNDVVTYSASINFGPAIAYKWTIENAALQTGGGNLPYAIVKFDQLGPAAVTVEVTNNCGIGTATHTIVNVTELCADPTNIHSSGTTNITTFSGKDVVVGPVSATFSSGSPETAYQWFSNTNPSTSGGTPISGATSNSYIVGSNAGDAAVGIHYYYCEVKNKNCNSAVLVSAVYTVKVTPNPAFIPIGNGNFAGKTCFDVAMINGGTCGDLSGRMPQKADFTLASTNEQIYTFTPSTNEIPVSDIRFFVDDPYGIVESITPEGAWEGAINLSGVYKLKVKYKNTLNNDAAGKSRVEALKAILYVVYNKEANGLNGADNDRSLKLTISVQDCICCPGYLAVGGEYKTNRPGSDFDGSDSRSFEMIKSYFTATGKDLCYYRTDGPSNAEWSKVVPPNKCNTDNSYVANDYRSMGGWRIPTAAELGALYNIYNKLSTQPTAMTGTANMAAGPYYLSSTQGGSEIGTWIYGKKAADGNMGVLDWRPIKEKGPVRCVMTFE